MSAQVQASSHARLALFWSIIGALSSLAVLPYALALNPLPEDVPLFVVVIAQPLQTGIFVFLGGWLALRLGGQLGLDSPIARAWVSRTPLPRIPSRRIGGAIGVGTVVGFLALGLDAFVFRPNMPQAKSPMLESGIPLWKGLLGSLYGGIGEELLTRLVFMTIITWLVWKAARGSRTPVAPWIYWTGILAAGVVFGLGHLPATAAIWDLTPVVISRGIVLNLVPAIAFGNLYWRWGLEYAMLAHFAGDIVLRIVGV